MKVDVDWVRIRRGTKKLELFLREQFPLGKPVTVRWVKCLPFTKEEAKELRMTEEQRLRGCFGICHNEARQFRIQLSARNTTVALAADTLEHEWAHALDARVGSVELNREDHHDPSFDLTFGTIRRGVMWGLKEGLLDWDMVYS